MKYVLSGSYDVVSLTEKEKFEATSCIVGTNIYPLTNKYL